MFQTAGGVTRISQRTHTRAVDVKDAMDAIHTQMLGALSIAAGLGLAMVWLAARMSMIELRRPHRCPACGRLRQGGSCGCPQR
jgi:hypothetical protein